MRVNENEIKKALVNDTGLRKALINLKNHNRTLYSKELSIQKFKIDPKWIQILIMMLEWALENLYKDKNGVKILDPIKIQMHKPWVGIGRALKLIGFFIKVIYIIINTYGSISGSVVKENIKDDK